MIKAYLMEGAYGVIKNDAHPKGPEEIQKIHSWGLLMPYSLPYEGTLWFNQEWGSPKRPGGAQGPFYVQPRH